MSEAESNEPAVSFECAECKTRHVWGKEPDGYHHGPWNEIGQAQGESEESIVKGDLKVTFENIGEGWSGDYDPEDPEDNNLLRIYIYLRTNEDGRADWIQVEDGSICTSLPAETAPLTRRHLLEMVFEDADASVSREENRISRHLMDEFSYVNPRWPEEGALMHLPDGGFGSASMEPQPPLPNN